MFGSEHKGHEFERMQDVYKRHVDLIKSETNGLRKRLKSLSFFMKDVQSTIDKVQKAKEEKMKEIDIFVELLQARLTSQLK